MSKMAKCGLQKYSFCTHKHDAIECTSCLLVKRHGKQYKWINGQKYKKCPHCDEYKSLSEFTANSQGNISWCNTCRLEYARQHAQKRKQEAKPIVKLTPISNENTFGKPQMLNQIEFKRFYKLFVEEVESGKKYIIIKL